MKRVYTLYRVSSKKQVNYSDDHSNDIPLQKGACHEFAKCHSDWKIIKEFEEKGVSGFKVSAKDRDAILDLQEAARKKEFDVLLVFMFDRIGRIDDETPFIVEWFVKAGIEVWSVKEGEQRFETHVDKLTNYIRFWQASGESEKTSIRIKTRIQQLKLMGIYTGGPMPYGYRLIPSNEVNRKGQALQRLAIDMEQYIIYRKVIEKTINNGTGCHVIARVLNEQGYKTANGKMFTGNVIRRMLKSKLARGITNTGETSDVLQELRIIKPEEEKALDQIIAQRAEVDEDKRRLARKTKGGGMLSGNIFCAHCGGRIVTTVYSDKRIRADGSLYSKRELKYRCYHKANKLCDCDGQTNYVAAQIDGAVSQMMKDIFANIKESPDEQAYQELLRKKKASYKASEQQIKLKLQKDQRQLEVLQLEIGKCLLGESVYSPDDLHNAIKIIKERVHNAEKRLDELKTEQANQEEDILSLVPAYKRFKSWAEEFDSAELEKKKMIACQLFDRIEIGKGYQITVHLNLTYKQFCEKVMA